MLAADGPALWAAATTTGVGAIAWVTSHGRAAAERRGTARLYFVLAIPAIALTAAIVSFFVPQRFWRWAMFPFAAQALVAFCKIRRQPASARLHRVRDFRCNLHDAGSAGRGDRQRASR